MTNLEQAIQKAEGPARTIGEILLEAARRSEQAAALLEQDMDVPELSLEGCAEALRKHARKNQKSGCWSCAVFGLDPENEAVKVILDYYKIPAEWLAAEGETAAPAAPQPKPPAPKPSPVIDLLDLL